MDETENKDSAHIKHALKQAFEHLEDLYDGRGKLNYCVLTGLKALDNITNGFHNGDLIAISGQPGVGKSAFALSLACGAATKHNGKGSVMVFSTQSAAAQLGLRALIAGARGIYGNIPRGIIRETDWYQFCNSAGRLSDLDLAINDVSSTMEEIFIYSRERKREHWKTCLIILDSLDSIAGENQTIYSEALVKLKQLARELNLPVIVTSAACERRKMTRFTSGPLFALLDKYADVLMVMKRLDMSSNTRFVDKKGLIVESGENADAVTFDKWNMEISVRKNKNGPNGSFNLDFLPQLSRFTGV